jgi:hypothetical protein
MKLTLLGTEAALLATYWLSTDAFSPGTTSRLRPLVPPLQPLTIKPRPYVIERYATLAPPDQEQLEEEEQSDEFEPATKILGKAIPYSDLTIGVVKETFPGENRVSQSPDTVRNLVKAGFNVVVQAGGACCGRFSNRWSCCVQISRSPLR